MSGHDASGDGPADRVQERTIKAPPSDEPQTAPQSPATCASAKSARPGAFRQAAGRVTDRAGLRLAGLAGSVVVAAAGTRNSGLVGVAVLLGAWWGIRHIDDIRWLLVTAALWALPLAVVPPLFSGDVGAYACQGQLFDHGLSPYRFGVADLPCTWLAHAPPLWLHTTTPYGPFWVALTGLSAAAGSYAGAVVVLRAVALAGIALTLGYGYRLARVLHTDASRVVWLGAAAPVVLLHGVSGVHNDALLAGLVVAGLAYGVSGRTGLRAGVLLGLAVAVKVTALVAVPFAVSLAARDRRPVPLGRATAAVAAGFAGAFAAATGATGLGLGWLPALSRTADLTQWTSVPTGVGIATGYLARWSGLGSWSGSAVTVARAAGLVALAVLLAGLWWRAREPREVVRDAGLALLATALLGPVFFPWYAFAALALLAVAAGESRWLAGTVTALSVLVLPDGRGFASMTKPYGAFLDLVVVVGLAVWWARRLRTRQRRAGRARPTATAH
jgi:alpha-1,6-mannosyltransferase